MLLMFYLIYIISFLNSHLCLLVIYFLSLILFFYIFLHIILDFRCEGERLNNKVKNYLSSNQSP